MQAPEVLGDRYELRGVLGRGGMAEVRDGWDMRLGRPVAIKLLLPLFSAQADNRRRFEVEARAAAALNHPHIVAVHDSGEQDGTPYIVMERQSGRTLGDLIERGPLPQQQVSAILVEVLSALAAAHAAGILHRDIKPGNILLTDSGAAKVADFGIAKTAESAHTMTGQIVGTMVYLSPERLAGRPATVADDLYAVGVVGFEALSGRRPFLQEDIGALARAILQDRPPALVMLRPDVDPRLAAVVERAMAREPQWRFASAEEMRAAVLGHVDPRVAARPPTRVLAAPLPDPTTMVPVRPVRSSRTKGLAWLAAVLAAIALAGVLLLLDSTSQPPTPEPASTSTSVPMPTPTSVAPPTTTTPPVVVNEDDGGDRKGGNGNGNGRKPKKGDD